MHETVEGGGQLRSRPRGQDTREAILDAAERLFAEHGLGNVSHRQISAAAGAGNNAAVNYHFGTAAALVEAIVDRRSEAVEALRARQLDAMGGSGDLRAWVDCLVRPTAAHLEELGSPTWYARLTAQLATDPRRRALVVERALRSPTLRQSAEGLDACLDGLSALPPPVRRARAEMMRLLAVHVYADHESALADGRTPARASWRECADGLVDALVGMLTAPVHETLGSAAER